MQIQTSMPRSVCSWDVTSHMYDVRLHVVQHQTRAEQSGYCKVLQTCHDGIAGIQTNCAHIDSFVNSQCRFHHASMATRSASCGWVMRYRHQHTLTGTCYMTLRSIYAEIRTAHMKLDRHRWICRKNLYSDLMVTYLPTGIYWFWEWHILD